MAATGELGVPRWLAGAAPAPGPGVPRPMAVTELLDEAFRVLRSQYRTLGPIVAVVATPLALLSAVATRQAFGDKGGISQFSQGVIGAGGGHGNWVIVLYVVALLWPALVGGPVCRVAAASWFGRVEPRRSAWRHGMRRVPALLAALVMVDLLDAAGTLMLIVPGVALWVLFHLTLPAMVVEDIGPFRGVARSPAVVGRRFWPVFAVTFLAFAVNLVVSQLLAIVPSGVAGLLGLHWGFLILAAGSIAVQSVTWSWSMIVVTLVYLDGRARREGLDLVVRATSRARPAPEATSRARPAPEATSRARPALEANATRRALPARESASWP